MYNYITNLKFEKKWLLLLFFSLKCYWYFAEYSIQTDNALRMQYGIQWTMGNFHPSHLDWAPLTTLYYSAVYSVTHKYFLFGDLFLIFVVAIWEASIITRIAKQFFAPKVQFWAIVSMIFYTGHAFTYQTNDIVVVWVFVEIVLALLNKQIRSVIFWTLLIPLLKYSAIAIVYLPFLYEFFKNKKIKLDNRKIIYALVALIATLIYLGLTGYSGFAGTASGFNPEHLKLLFRFDHFWLKYGVSEYLFISFVNNVDVYFNVFLDVQLITLIVSTFVVLSVFLFLVKRYRIDWIKGNKELLKIILIVCMLHFFYMVALLLLLPLEKIPSLWKIGPHLDSIVLLEIGRYHNFLSFIFFVLFLKLCNKISFNLLKTNAIFLMLVFVISFKFSGNLFEFYNSLYMKKHNSFGVKVSKQESKSHGVRNYEAWKVYYILRQKDPAERFH